ncbi:MAG: 7-carboxy-7-deazaguanine synthase QueE [Desulfobacter sp.]|nr:MAG: 7-carboxy-7-deazaguanine synthase QueE [Desulfobacter sp.]
MFSSIQGEGPFMGRPALFIRLSGCLPPFCPWCDTAYAQGPGNPVDIGDILSRAETDCTGLAVITGGEPFVQWKDGLDRLEAGLLDMGLRVQYETSGKRAIPEACQGYKVCSPKYLDGRWQVAPESITRADCFKFVADKDIEPIEAFIATHAIPPEKIWLMPLGDNREAQLRRTPDIWQYCVEKGFNFSPRLHTLAFNNKKGI